VVVAFAATPAVAKLGGSREEMPSQGDDTFLPEFAETGNHPRGKPPGTFRDRLHSGSTQPVRSGHDPAKLPGRTDAPGTG